MYTNEVRQSEWLDQLSYTLKVMMDAIQVLRGNACVSGEQSTDAFLTNVPEELAPDLQLGSGGQLYQVINSEEIQKQMISAVQNLDRITDEAESTIT